MSDRLTITGFKCFEQASFDLNKLTVLCGNNGSGKSSVLQALLLARTSIEKNSILKGESYDLSVWNSTPTPLNGEYELALGILDEIVRDGNTSIEIGGLLFELNTEELSNDYVSIRYSKISIPKAGFITKKEFYYLNAERIGPRYISECKSKHYPYCGHKGENTAQVLSSCETYKVPRERIAKNGDTDNFRIQVDRWLDYICPGISIIVEPAGNLNRQIKIRNGNLNNISSAATNIGFGLSYLLPIIVTGLIAKEGSTFIIENPEAHLHPKAQSNLGFFRENCRKWS